MKIAPLVVDCSITPPGQTRIPVVDQAMELAKIMESYCPREEIGRFLVSVARTWEVSTTFVVKSR